eukprot:TRINITY_DN366_c0_g2_i1.p2 TRINITY_DN366_c0_g2~~TRINITY_DN366_c0_g2_i1.p2  ORF type:complete len:263 (+),score=49.03 TRINITY_DN366_c0_g2_i1:130-918(+)
MANIPNRKRWQDVQGTVSWAPWLPQIGLLLRDLAAEGDQGPAGPASHFCSQSVPTCSIPDYLIRFAKYSCASPEVFALAAIFMDRALSRVQWTLSSRNVHRLFAASFVVAAKARDDVFYSNKYYSMVTGLALADLNHQEQVLLVTLDWTLHVEAAWFDSFLQRLMHYQPSFAPAVAAPPIPAPAAAGAAVSTSPAPAALVPAGSPPPAAAPAAEAARGAGAPVVPCAPTTPPQAQRSRRPHSAELANGGPRAGGVPQRDRAD